MPNESNDDETGSVHYLVWGSGDPLIALHPLALESTAFAGVGAALASLGLRTLAADLPGFGKTPLVDGPLTPAALAEPVIELARSLERAPILMGMSMGGRVAIEVALRAPDAVRGLVLVAPFLPWRGYRRARALASYLNPEWAERLPLEHIWPLLQRASPVLEAVPSLEHDWFAQACVRVAYYSTCPATRIAFLSAARELALDPAFGESGLWTRLPELTLPVAFLWAGKDRLIPRTHVTRPLCCRAPLSWRSPAPGTSSTSATSAAWSARSPSLRSACSTPGQQAEASRTPTEAPATPSPRAWAAMRNRPRSLQPPPLSSPLK